MEHAGRSLHLLDVEYLGCGPQLSGEDLGMVMKRYRWAAHWHLGDHLVGAASTWTWKRIAFDAPDDINLRPAGGGPDAADLELIEWAHTIDLTRYDRVVIASGDHIFTDLTIELHELRIEAWVVGYGFSIARRLAASADRTVNLAGGLALAR